MRAINTDGKGVHECNSKTEFESSFIEIFQKPLSEGGNCILVKDKAEAESVMSIAENYCRRIHDMTSVAVEVNQNKWNLMTVEQAKGLEFETVFAVSGRMSENEKYIAYTRALNELYVYDEAIDLIENKVSDSVSIDSNNSKKISTVRKKRVKRTSKGAKGSKLE